MDIFGRIKQPADLLIFDNFDESTFDIYNVSVSFTFETDTGLKKGYTRFSISCFEIRNMVELIGKRNFTSHIFKTILKDVVNGMCKIASGYDDSIPKPEKQAPFTPFDYMEKHNIPIETLIHENCLRELYYKCTKIVNLVSGS